MAGFLYRAVGPDGKTEEGVLEAADLRGALEVLKGRGFLPVEVVPAGRSPALWRQKFRLSEVVYLCRQFATVLSAGVSLLGGIEIMRRQRLSKRLKTELERLSAGVRSGRPLSELLAEGTAAYPPLVVNMVSAGELSGNLESVFENLAAYYEREMGLRRKVASLLVYPSILVVAACGLIFFFINFLLPDLSRMLRESGAPLPLITRAVIFLSYFLKDHLWVLGATAGVLALVLGWALKVEPVRERLERAALSLPAAGRLIRAVVQARFCLTLHLLLQSGVPLLTSLEALEKVIGFLPAARGVRRAAEGIRRGEQLAPNLAGAQFFDDMFVRFVSIGEETGELEGLLQLMARNYEAESEAGFARLAALVEPAITLFMGVVVGGVVLSVVLPVFGLIDTLKR